MERREAQGETGQGRGARKEERGGEEEQEGERVHEDDMVGG